MEIKTIVFIPTLCKISQFDNNSIKEFGIKVRILCKSSLDFTEKGMVI